MYINIRHNIDSMEGGFEVDEIIRDYCRKLGMVEGNYSKYRPVYLYLQYENTTMKQFSSLKKKLQSSKKLKKCKNGKNIVINCVANNVC